MLITVLSATTETVPTAKGSYQKLELAFKGEDGQVKGKKIMSFGAAAKAFQVLSKSQSGESYEITAVKNDATGYWDWTGATKSNGSTPSSAPTGQPAAAPASNSGRSTYETPEERAKKQVYIVRQSSLATAVAFYGVGGSSVGNVINTAKQFEAYVFGLGDTPAAAESKHSFEGDEDQIV